MLAIQRGADVDEDQSIGKAAALICMDVLRETW